MSLNVSSSSRFRCVGDCVRSQLLHGVKTTVYFSAAIAGIAAMPAHLLFYGGGIFGAGLFMGSQELLEVLASQGRWRWSTIVLGAAISTGGGMLSTVFPDERVKPLIATAGLLSGLIVANCCAFRCR